MTCYFRHLGEVFERAGVEVTRENRVEVDRAIHSLVGVGYRDCPAAWREVKGRLSEDEGAFVVALREALGA